MLINSTGEKIDAFIVYARPARVSKESVGTLLNGNWHIQTIGKSAKMINVQLVCSWDVVQEIQRYAITKEYLTVDYLDFEETGFIIGTPAYDLLAPGRGSPSYVVTFELAVIPDV